jgi:hypothetical protein
MQTFLSYDHFHGPTDGWSGPKFELSQDYPREQPPPEGHAWEAINFKENARAYLIEVLRYLYEGNIEVDWVVQKNAVRPWFHAPWMDAAEIRFKRDSLTERCRDEKGREFIHGLTRERATSLAEMNFGQPNQACVNNIENWAVSIYNVPGGYTIGRVWREMTVEGRLPSPQNFPKDFPVGTVVAKLLFTTATPAEVPYLAGSPEWRADIKRGKPPVTVRLLQIDTAVRDRQAESNQDQIGSGWVFGTFAYNAQVAPAFEDGKDFTLPWRRLEPLGLMYGNELNQTILVSDVIKQSQHLGCETRLAGPVDNLTSSCLACHNLAEVDSGARITAVMNYGGRNKYNACRCKDDVDYWFKTLQPGEPFTTGGTSLNFSLQLNNGILRYCQHNKDRCAEDPNHHYADDDGSSSPSLEPCVDPVPPPSCPKPAPGSSTTECTNQKSQSAAQTLSSSQSTRRSFSISRGGDVEESIDADAIPQKSPPKKPRH